MAKKLFIFFIFASSVWSESLYGQPFFENNTKYAVKRDRDVESPDYYTFEELYLDSVITGTEYYHVLRSVGKNTSKILYKVNDGKVYIISKSFAYKPNQYHLIYDFNLNPGDIITIDTTHCGCFSGYKNYTIRVDSIKPVRIGNKSKKAQFVTLTYKTFEKYNYTFVEGLGCLETGLIYFEVGGFFNTDRWICKRICLNDSAYKPKLKSGKLDYLQTPCMDSAYQKIVPAYGIEPPKNVLIYPNPFKNEFSIQNHKGSIQLYDITGSLKFEEQLCDFKTLNFEYLPKGIYFLKISNDKGSQIKKVLKI